MQLIDLMEGTETPRPGDAVSDVVARGVGAIGLAGIALIHLLDLPGQLSEAPYLFVLYLARWSRASRSRAS
jgi:hypothetical protein